MSFFSTQSVTDRICALFALLLAITLQIQVTLFQTPVYEGLRIAASDLLVPFIGLIIFFSLITKRSLWPKWKKPFGYWVPVILTVVFLLAMINGYLVQGELSRWALINKFTGWFLLIAYLGTGAWIVTNANEKVVSLFIKGFCWFFLITGWMFAGLLFADRSGTDLDIIESSQSLQGLMANRNAYAFLFSVVTSLITVFGFKQETFKTRSLYAYWILFPVFIMLNRSRTLWICAAFLVLLFFKIDWKKSIKIILPSFIIGLVIFYGLSNPSTTEAASKPYDSMSSLYAYVQDSDNKAKEENATHTGDISRIEIIKGAWELIKQYPIQGAGLGSVVYFQEKEHGSRINIIDNTPLWILTEMGLIGLLIFLSCYGSIALAMKNELNQSDLFQKNLAVSVLMMLLCFAVFSLFHEILYTRFFWFILGLALAVPKMRQAQQAS